ncbi:hypothetical protein IFM89_004655 [Coptis chinensis]|uniref:DUF6857 domain-containing protein n=1 Tax=Coptis chinensis TaxID=261450 RepID=A0A835M1I6_9MAGN|nr:hypothetical protein IFM89_004655 [Coptis chinensis]
MNENGPDKRYPSGCLFYANLARLGNEAHEKTSDCIHKFRRGFGRSRFLEIVVEVSCFHPQFDRADDVLNRNVQNPFLYLVLATILILSLLNCQDINSPKIQSVEKHANEALEQDIILPSPARTSVSKRQAIGTNHSKVQVSASNHVVGSLTSVSAINEALELARYLQSEMQLWFLRFVEEILVAGFSIFDINSIDGDGIVHHQEHGPIAAVLSNLKRINTWLDRVGEKREEMLTEKIENVKRKIYGAGAGASAGVLCLRMKNLSTFFIAMHSTGFARGSSKYRGATLHKCGRWEARMGLFLGKK